MINLDRELTKEEIETIVAFPRNNIGYSREMHFIVQIFRMEKSFRIGYGRMRQIIEVIQGLKDGSISFEKLKKEKKERFWHMGWNYETSEEEKDS